jgi:peptide/nickel transport system substrate-binding protein
VTTIPLLQQVRSSSKQFKVVSSPSDDYQFLGFNTSAPPFNNILAREAIAYATNVKSIDKNLYDNFYKQTESPSAPAETFYEATVPGYRSYNLAKAQALVRQIGGLSLTLDTLTNTPYYVTLASALATQWEAAGMTVNIHVDSLPQALVEDVNHTYEVHLMQWGAIDNGIQLPNFWGCGGHSSGVCDPALTGLFNQGTQFVAPTSRARIYEEIAELISKQQYGVFLYSDTVFSIVSKQVVGVTDAMPEVHWEDVGLAA